MLTDVNRKPGVGPPLCNKGQEMESLFYRPLQSCIGGTQSKRWIPIEARKAWPSRANLNATELKLYGNFPDLIFYIDRKLVLALIFLCHWGLESLHLVSLTTNNSRYPFNILLTMEFMRCESHQ